MSKLNEITKTELLGSVSHADEGVKFVLEKIIKIVEEMIERLGFERMLTVDELKVICIAVTDTIKKEFDKLPI